ncbi:MAG: DUF1697 domain-containing protein [Lentimicrobium sp.]|nr:DUF1697 domain-containing protein [Lentimicrobium sp.]
MKNQFKLEVPALSIPKEELIQIHSDNPFVSASNRDKKSLYITFLSSNPENQKFTSITKETFLPDEFIVREKVIYLYCHNGYGSTKLNNNFFERKLGVKATTRNFNTVEKLIDL